METAGEKIIQIAKRRGIDLNKVRKELSESLKIPLIDENLNCIKNPTGDEIMELVGDPTVITQLLRICPTFFSVPYIIAKTETRERINKYIFSTQIKILEKSERSITDTDHINYKKKGLLYDIVSKANVLIIPRTGLSYSTDDPYPVLILDKNGERFCVKYSSATPYYKTNKYSKQIDAGVGAAIDEEDVFGICNAKDIPYMALTNNEIEGYYYLDGDNKIKGMK